MGFFFQFFIMVKRMVYVTTKLGNKLRYSNILSQFVLCLYVVSIVLFLLKLFHMSVTGFRTFCYSNIRYG